MSDFLVGKVFFQRPIQVVLLGKFQDPVDGLLGHLTTCRDVVLA
ncbi:hypothetical protein [Fibrobacter sp. UWH9]|nr:hypothetical protein [Fibrobacter sp. UWH9]